jgi:hypothetical protein
MRFNHLQQVVFCLWCAVALLAIIAFCSVAKAHIAGHPEWDEWLRAQQTPNDHPFSCWDKSDAYLLEDEDLRFASGEIEARIPGYGWIKFPNTGQGNPGNTILGAVGNPTGGAIAWAYYGKPFCLSLGTMS